MKRAGQKCAHDEIDESIRTKISKDENVEGDLCSNVAIMDRAKRYLVHHHGPDCVENQLERAEEGLSQHRVQEEGFKCRGQIGIDAIDAQRFVVSQMVLSETSR